MITETYKPFFTYDEAVKASNAAERGYTTLKSMYSRPGRCEKFLRKRLSHKHHYGLVYMPGAIYEFTVKARKYRIFVLVLPSSDGKTQQFATDKPKMAVRQYRYFDTLDEVLHARALRDLPERKPLNIGHLKGN